MFAGKAGQMAELAARDQRILLVGLGKRGETDAFAVAGSLGRRLAQLEGGQVSILADKLNWEDFGCGLAVLSWQYNELRGTATPEKPMPVLTLHLPQDQLDSAIRGMKIGEAVNLARDLSQTPPNIATPYWMAEQAEALAKEFGMSCRVIKGEELEKEKMAGLINVGKASEHLPCFIRLEYKPKGSKEQPIVLMGKTMTYDTGGLSLKVNHGMVGMKRDKDGGCAVMGAMRAIADVIKPNRPVVGILVAAENCISDEAYRPDDVLTFRNGVTVEVTNTDAEGRLVLADGLCWACEKENPAAIVDIATLTGGVVVALGKVFAGNFSNDEGLAARLNAAGNATRERLWRLPLDAEYNDLMKSPVADIVNSNLNRQAHPVQGATFLSYFVQEGIPWAHLDIAGTHSAEKDKGPYIAGPTGFGVRLLARFAETF
jgi:leucyl aminopeptidase